MILAMGRIFDHFTHVENQPIRRRQAIRTKVMVRSCSMGQLLDLHARDQHHGWYWYIFSCLLSVSKTSCWASRCPKGYLLDQDKAMITGLMPWSKWWQMKILQWVSSESTWELCTPAVCPLSFLYVHQVLSSLASACPSSPATSFDSLSAYLFLLLPCLVPMFLNFQGFSDLLFASDTMLSNIILLILLVEAIFYSL